MFYFAKGTCKLGILLNIDLLCGLVIITASLPTILTDPNCLRQKSAHLALNSERFYFYYSRRFDSMGRPKPQVTDFIQLLLIVGICMAKL